MLFSRNRTSDFLWRLTLIACLFLCAATVQAQVIGLALSGGGARGFAHIGVLAALEEEGLEPDLIVGSSIGAVVGGLYCAGYSTNRLKNVAATTDWSSLFLDRPSRRNLFLGQKETTSRHILALRFRGWSPELPQSLSNGQRLSDLLFDLVQRAPYHAYPSFDDLRIPFRAVTTDLVTGEAVVFSSGDLSEAMRASASAPLIFAPYRLGDRMLVDGGLIENIPVEISRQQGADYVIAVDLSTEIGSSEGLDMPWEVADRVTTIMHLERNRDSRELADVLISVETGSHKSTDFDSVDALIRAGYEATRAKMDEIRRLFETVQERPRRSRCMFCSQAVLERFEESVPARGLPPEDYLLEGVTQMPDTQLQRLPSGDNGLRKLELLRRSYMDRGLTMARVVDLEMGSDGVLYSRWEEGRLLSIRVDGLKRYSSGAVLREFPLREGDLFDLRRVNRGIQQIYGSDLFQSVALSAMPVDSGVHLTIRAEERGTPQLRLGAGFSIERKGRGFAEFLNDNVGNTGARLSIFGKYGELDEELRLRLTQDRIPMETAFDRLTMSYLTAEFSTAWKREENYFYDRFHDPTMFYFYERTETELRIGRAFRRWGLLSSGLKYENIRAGGVFDEPSTYVTSVGLESRVDTRDRHPFPASGLYFRSRYDAAIRPWSDDRAFNRFAVIGDLHYPLTRRYVLHGRVDYAWNDRILPLWGQHYLGGERSLLGLHQNEQFGNVRLVYLMEMRHDLISRWLADAYISLLYTIGAVSAETDPFPESENYLHGVGGALSLSTLLGPMRFTVGELLKSHYGTGQTRIYLNLGHEF